MNNNVSESSTLYPSELVGFYLLCKKSPVEHDLIDSFIDSLCVSRYKTMQVLLWTCDNKVGLGTDEVFKEVAGQLVLSTAINTSFKMKIVRVLERLSKWHLVVELLKYQMSAKLRIFIFNEIKKALKFGNINCAKSMPRNGEVANRIRGYMKLSPTEWRKTLVELCHDQVTVLMSANKWDQIDYSKLPTHLIVQYYNAFRRHDKERFKKYLELTPARAITVSRIIKSNRPKTILQLSEVLEVATYFDPTVRKTIK